MQHKVGVLTDRLPRFFHVEERNPDGSLVLEMDAEAHSEFFWRLISKERSPPWHATFVKQRAPRERHDRGEDAVCI